MFWWPPLPGSDGGWAHVQSPCSVLHEREEQQFLFIHLAQDCVQDLGGRFLNSLFSFH